ncbi:MAG: hypothetical protein JSW01_06010 [Candidatus Bathyarchaeota archaeon]|nr:MAG: hypothetical protein JSW01_06010 [Candidatus Bathyarchaeota archaeon]
MNITRIGIGVACIGLHYGLKRVGGLPAMVKRMVTQLLLYLGILLVISGFV